MPSLEKRKQDEVGQLSSSNLPPTTPADVATPQNWDSLAKNNSFSSSPSSACLTTTQPDFSWSRDSRPPTQPCSPGVTGFQYTNTGADNKPRMRICFDPEHEIPKLQAWFAENNHPSRLQVEDYVLILNSLESRKGKKPLDVNNVIYWFKNTRAAVKRAQAKTDRPFLDPFYLQRLQSRGLGDMSDRLVDDDRSQEHERIISTTSGHCHGGWRV